jgi:hypothetical protein
MMPQRRSDDDPARRRGYRESEFNPERERRRERDERGYQGEWAERRYEGPGQGYGRGREREMAHDWDSDYESGRSSRTPGDEYGRRDWAMGEEAEGGDAGYGPGPGTFRGRREAEGWVEGDEPGRGYGPPGPARHGGPWGRLGRGEWRGWGQGGAEWERPGPMSGRGPQGWQRSDERICEDVCERMTQHGYLDASEIEVSVTGGVVSLRGAVADRRQKRLAEDVAESVRGVLDVRNELSLGGGQKEQGIGDRGEGAADPVQKGE